MWKSEKSPRSSVAEGQESTNGNGSYEDPSDVGVFSRANTGAPASMDELRGQGGFGVIVAASDMQGTALSTTPNIGSRFTSELDSISRRERQVREIQELATHRVVDLTTEQLRRILEFMV